MHPFQQRKVMLTLTVHTTHIAPHVWCEARSGQVVANYGMLNNSVPLTGTLSFRALH